MGIDVADSRGADDRGMRNGCKWLCSAAIAVSLLLGCLPNDDAEELVAVRSDSAGVAILEFLPKGIKPHRLPSEAVLELGRLDTSAEAFGFVVGGLFVAERQLVVADGLGSRLRFFGHGGSQLLNVGGRGMGPGEFEMLRWVSRYSADSVAAVESGTRRVTIIGPDGGIGRVFQPNLRFRQIQAYVARQSCCAFWGRFEDGSLLVSTPDLAPTEGSGRRRGRVLVGRVTPDGRSIKEIAYISGAEYTRTASRKGGFSPFHFGGGVRLAAQNGGFVVTDGITHSILFYDPEGVLVRIARIQRPRVPLTEAMRRASEQRFDSLAEEAGGSLAASGLELRRGRPYPDSLASYNDLRVDAMGKVWAGYISSDIGEGTPYYDVFSGTGEYLGTLLIPHGVRVLDATDRYILTSEMSSLGVPGVKVFEISVGGSGTPD